MKFENIKIGDTVYVERRVSYSWNNAASFTVPEKVVKVTKTQFTTESGNRYKKDGREFGTTSWGWAYKVGDKKSNFSDEVVSDQTEQMDLFSKKLSTENHINSMIEKLHVPLNSGLTIAELNSIKDKLTEVQTLLKPNTK